MPNISVQSFTSTNSNNNVVKFHKVHNSNNDTCKYTQTRYLKQELDNIVDEDTAYYGRFRSVTQNTSGDVIGYGIPKSLSISEFEEKNDINDTDIIIQECIEGTQIQLFYDTTRNCLFDDSMKRIIHENNQDSNVGWMISTRSCIGAKNSFFKSQEGDKTKTHSFAELFIDCCLAANIDISSLNKAYCYNFIIQHPEQQIVNVYSESRVYLVNIYNIHNNGYDDVVIDLMHYQKPLSEYGISADMKIYTPCLFETTMFNKVEDVKELYREGNNSTSKRELKGVVIKNVLSGDHTVIENPHYVYLRELRGNQPKLEYRYLQLRQENRIQEFLRHFPEHKASFDTFYSIVEEFSNELYNCYVSLNIEKCIQPDDVPFEMTFHINNIHCLYLKILRPLKKSMGMSHVCDYVNNMHPSKLMFALNYKHRK